MARKHSIESFSVSLIVVRQQFQHGIEFAYAVQAMVLATYHGDSTIVYAGRKVAWIIQILSRIWLKAPLTCINPAKG
jgi:hypothetical protein